MLSRFRGHLVPLLKELKETILQVAMFTIISQPQFAIKEMKRGLMSAHPNLWKNCSKEALMEMYPLLTPTPQRVLNMLSEPCFNNATEEAVFDYLRRFVLSLSNDNLCKFLRFATGNPQCGLQKIKVCFHE